ncbi:uroporphyrinogen-III synthase [Gammaproteobacteria bacterium AB-CW1]|uniref:Uroporphyrinogen-III synthase n=1 Tax=Natronospira elongata TaxID=3110268 RepID=A0AAP6MK06_9GAMM|nr:uroporphyrinogen-III synthase [Gammaproteobacteria bacterium AB-CW1]
MDSPLHGAGILVTRPAAQLAGAIRAVADAGGDALAFPLLKLEWREPAAEETAALAQLQEDDWLLPVSPGAVEALGHWLAGCRPALPRLRAAAVGQATAEALREQAWQVSATPTEGDGAAALLASPDFKDLDGRRVLICRGEGGRRVLDQQLPARGAEVLALTLYRRAPAESDPARLGQWLKASRLHCLLLTSASSLEALLARLDASLLPSLQRLAVVAPSERVLKMAAEAGFTGPLLAAPDASDRAMVRTAADWWQGNRTVS